MPLVAHTPLTDQRDADLLAAMDHADAARHDALAHGDTHPADEPITLGHLIEEALNRGFVIDALNCSVGDRVTNRRGETGTVSEVRYGPSSRVMVTWDIPSIDRHIFFSRHLFAGELKHLSPTEHRCGHDYDPWCDGCRCAMSDAGL